MDDDDPETVEGLRKTTVRVGGAGWYLLPLISAQLAASLATAEA